MKFALALIVLIAMFAPAAKADGNCAGQFQLVQPAGFAVVQPGFQLQSFGGFGVFQPTNAVFAPSFGSSVVVSNGLFNRSVVVNNGFAANAVVVNRGIGRAAVVAPPRRGGFTFVRQGLFGTTVIQR